MDTSEPKDTASFSNLEGLIGRVYCIDDGVVDGRVKRGNRVIVEHFNGGSYFGTLLDATKIIADDIRRYADS